MVAGNQNQAFNAIAFFYMDILGNPLYGMEALCATRPVHLRHALTISETGTLLQAVCDRAGYPTNLIARLLYGCELRVTEPLNQRIKDLNLEAAILFIRSVKGGKDRTVSAKGSPVPCISQGHANPRNQDVAQSRRTTR